jgi:hypothetical protein
VVVTVSRRVRAVNGREADIPMRGTAVRHSANCVVATTPVGSGYCTGSPLRGNSRGRETQGQGQIWDHIGIYACRAARPVPLPMVHRHNTHRWLLSGYRRHQCPKSQSTLGSRGQQSDAQFHDPHNCTCPDHPHRHIPRQYVQEFLGGLTALGGLATLGGLAALLVLLHQ